MSERRIGIPVVLPELQELLLEVEEMTSDFPGYTLMHGESITGPKKKIFFHGHTPGPNDDGTDSVRRSVWHAAENGADLILTPHNSLQAVDKGFRIRDNNGLRNVVGMVAGQEYAARDLSTGQHRHMLILGIDTEVPPGKSEADANRFTHRRGGISVAAHPGLGNYSTDIAQIRVLSLDPDPEVAYDMVEVENGSVRHALSRARNLGCFGEKIGLPQYDLNAAAMRFMRDEGEGLDLGYIGGSDSHSLDQIDDVLLVRPEEVPLFDAIVQRKINIYRKNNPNQVTIVQFGKIRVSNILGKLLNLPGINDLYHAR